MHMTPSTVQFWPAGLTAAVLAVATGATPVRAARWHAPIAHACTFFEIATPQRLAAFLAQIGHESGRLLYVRELWGPTPAQRRYEGRADLGNVQPGDGKRYMGRGLIQITGRANYAATRDGLRARLGKDAVPDFEARPELLEDAQWAALSAAWYWDSRALNRLADTGDMLTITRRINGGLNGYVDRLSLYEAAKSAFGT